jgi:Zn-dependent protease
MLPVLVGIFGFLAVTAMTQAKPLHEVLPGPFTMTLSFKKDIAEHLQVGGDGWLSASVVVCYLVGFNSVVIGLANMIPLFSGDGTMTVMEYLSPIASKWVWRVTLTLLVSILLVSVLGDAVWVFNKWRAS